MDISLMNMRGRDSPLTKYTASANTLFRHSIYMLTQANGTINKEIPRSKSFNAWAWAFKRVVEFISVQSGYSGFKTGNGEKINNIQACCLAQLCLAAA